MTTFDQIQSLSEAIGDSFYIFKKTVLEDNITEFKAAFNKYYSNVNLGYSVKTNYIPYACKVAYGLGSYIEVVSEMELQLALKSGVPISSIIYNGPIKNDESLALCLLEGAMVNVDNLNELQNIVQITTEYPEKNFKIGIRINIPLNDGFESRFGFDVRTEDFTKALQLIKETQNLSVAGLHTHSTRPDKSVESYLRRLEALHETYNKYFSGALLEYLDLGGGFFGKMDENIRSQFPNVHIVSFEEYGEQIATKMKEYFPDEKIELILEPGLAMTVNILDFVCKVANVRKINGKNIATTTGSFHNIKPSGHSKNLTVERFSTTQDAVMDKTDIVGYTCLENDIIHRDYPYALAVGDYLNFKNVGAYTLVFKPIFIKLTPAIIVLNGDEYEIIKHYDDIDNLFNCYQFTTT